MTEIKHLLFFITVLALLIFGYVKTFGDLILLPFRAEVCVHVPGAAKQIVPDGALWRTETIREATAPAGYTRAVAWVNVATVLPCADIQKPALVEIRTIRIIESKENEEKVIFAKDFTDSVAESFAGALFQRVPFWFGPGEGKISSIDNFAQGSFVINVRQIPKNIYHGWTNPRVVINSEAMQRVELEVRVTGGARLQLGMDYWRDEASDYNGYDPECQTSNNCEAWIGEWQGDTNGEFILLRSPKNKEIQ
jgi:hypothetical protein